MRKGIFFLCIAVFILSFVACTEQPLPNDIVETAVPSESELHEDEAAGETSDMGDSLQEDEPEPKTSNDESRTPDGLQSTANTQTESQETSKPQTSALPSSKPTAPTQTTTPSAPPATTIVNAPEGFNTAEEQKAIQLVNQYRQQNGLNALTVDSGWKGFSDKLTKLMASRKVAMHGPAEREVVTVKCRLPEQSGPSFTAEEAMNNFKNSPDHNACLLSPYAQYISCSIYNDGKGNSYVAIELPGSTYDSFLTGAYGDGKLTEAMVVEEWFRLGGNYPPDEWYNNGGHY